MYMVCSCLLCGYFPDPMRFKRFLSFPTFTLKERTRPNTLNLDSPPNEAKNSSLKYPTTKIPPQNLTILFGRLRQCGIVNSTRGDPGCQQILLLTNCVRVPREFSFGKVTRLPSRFQRSLCRGGWVRGSLPTFYCFIGETNCRLASLAGMWLRG